VCGQPLRHDSTYHECSHPGCYFAWRVETSADAPPASAPPLHVHTCTDPGPFIAQIAERDAEIARLQEAGNALMDVAWHDEECPQRYEPRRDCVCGYEAASKAWRALAGAAPKTETPRG